MQQLERHLSDPALELRGSLEASPWEEYIFGMLELLARAMPDYDERKQEVAKRGAGPWFGGIS